MKLKTRRPLTRKPPRRAAAAAPGLRGTCSVCKAAGVQLRTGGRCLDEKAYNGRCMPMF